MGSSWSQDDEVPQEQLVRDATQQQQQQQQQPNRSQQLHDAHPKPNTLKDAKEVKLTTNSSSKPPTERKPQVQAQLPHNLEDILKDADSPIDRSSMDKLYQQLTAGIYLKKKKQVSRITMTSSTETLIY